MEEGAVKKGNSGLIIFLVLIIIALAGYIAYTSNIIPKTDDKIVGNKSLEILERTRINVFENDYYQVLKVKNNTQEAFTNVTPSLIFYDANGMPFYEGNGSNITYFGPGETRYIECWDTSEEYSKAELGLFEQYDPELKDVVDLRDQITYEAYVGTTEDDPETEVLMFKGKNNSDKKVSLEFQVPYYSGDKLLYEDSFVYVLEPGEELDTYDAYHKTFDDETPFPEGYTYEAILAEAVEYVDEDYGEFVSEISDEDLQYLDSDELIEHFVFKELEKIYEDKMFGAKIYIDKIYTKEDVEDNEFLKELNLDDDDMAFETTFHVLPKTDEDVDMFLIPNGEYDEETGWVKNMTRVGVLRINEDGYSIDYLGSGW